MKMYIYLLLGSFVVVNFAIKYIVPAAHCCHANMPLSFSALPTTFFHLLYHSLATQDFSRLNFYPYEFLCQILHGKTN